MKKIKLSARVRNTPMNLLALLMIICINAFASKSATIAASPSFTFVAATNALGEPVNNAKIENMKTARSREAAERKNHEKRNDKDKDMMKEDKEEEQSEYERLKTKFIDAKDVPIWDSPTESALKSMKTVDLRNENEGEQKRFDGIGSAMKFATKEKDVDAVISSYLTKRSRDAMKRSIDDEYRVRKIEDEQRLGVPGLLESLIGAQKESEIQRKSRFPEHVFGTTRNVDIMQKTRVGWELTFSDEFDADYLDLEKWTPRNGAPSAKQKARDNEPAISQLGSSKHREGGNSESSNGSGSSSERKSSSSGSGGTKMKHRGGGSFLGEQEETVDKETWYHERNCKIVDGSLVIASRKTVGKYDKQSNDDDNDDSVFLDIPGAQKFSESEFPFESCYIDSSKAFSQVYGRYEVRARLPGLSYNQDDKNTCAGVFPRIELLPDPEKTVPKDACWPRGGDIRVAQAFGHGRGGPGAKIGAVESGYHFMPSGSSCGADGYVVDRTRPFELMNQVEKSEYVVTNSSSSLASTSTSSSGLGEEEKIKFNDDWAREFHVFAVEWDKESLRFFIDDIFTHEVNAYSAPMIPRWPFFVGIGTSVSPYGVLEALKNCNADDQFAFIDYVRVYSKKSAHEELNSSVYFFWLFALIVLPTLAAMYCSAKYLIRQVIREDLFGHGEGPGNFESKISESSVEVGDQIIAGKAKGVSFESLTDEKRRRRRLLRKLKREMGVIDSVTAGTTEPLLTKILCEKEEIAKARVERAFEAESNNNNIIEQGAMDDETYKKYAKLQKQKETKSVGGVSLRLPDITPKRSGNQTTYFSETSDFTTDFEGLPHDHHQHHSEESDNTTSKKNRNYGTEEL